MRMDPPVKLTGQTKSWTSSKSTNDKVKGEKEKKDVKPHKAATASDSKYTSEFLRQKLREHFHHTDFKSTLQKDAIKEIMQGMRNRWHLFFFYIVLKRNQTSLKCVVIHLFNRKT